MIWFVSAVRKVEFDDRREILHGNVMHCDCYDIGFLHVCGMQLQSRELKVWLLQAIKGKVVLAFVIIGVGGHEVDLWQDWSPRNIGKVKEAICV